MSEPQARASWRQFYDAMYEAPAVRIGPAQWMVAGYHDVNRIMENAGAALPALFPATSAPGLNALFLNLLPYEHGPNHNRLREIGRSLFSSETIRVLQGEISALAAERVLPTLFQESGCDLHTAFAIDLPRFTSAILLDVARDDWEWLGRSAATMYGQLGRYDQSDEELERAETTLSELREYVQRRAAGPAPIQLGGVGNRLVELFRAGHLDEDELLHFFALFMFTGMDTLTHAIENSLWFLAARPDLFDCLRADPRLSAAAFDEALRLWGPIRLCTRQIQEPIALEGCALPEGATILLLLHAANLDSRGIDEPHSFRWARRAGHRFAYGAGAHDCMGAPIARAVGASIFKLLASSCERLMAGPEESELRFRPSLQILAIESDPLRAVAAG